MSKDLDGIGPWLDPLLPIDAERMAEAARVLKKPPEAIRRRYEPVGRVRRVSAVTRQRDRNQTKKDEPPWYFAGPPWFMVRTLLLPHHMPLHLAVMRLHMNQM
uniref:wHTH-Hsp90 Na associated domain-containing protein n=1 Tax=Candidatus Kentrum sp. FW TaxID=2126338 RepID=A0A450U4Q8_9GAMM|nr:MAG: hypothetical protein BECKFW1821C_GA0114237_12143 [Candidatus Kentron sp. FW]